MSISNTFLGSRAVLEVLRRAKTVFFVGIGGVQMEALALILAARGYTVRGSDRRESAATVRLRAAGVSVVIGHREENIENADCLFYTLAVSRENPELCAAQSRAIPAFSRADLLGALMTDAKERIAVAGMHGKSTATAMLAAILRASGSAPTVVGGAPLGGEEAAYLLGGGDTFLCEACEYRDSFLCLEPTVALILNTEWEHTDYFKTPASVARSFSRFAARAQTLILPDEGADGILTPPDARVIRFGFTEKADARATHLSYEGGAPAFNFSFDGKTRGRVFLSVLGEHNAKNALAALAAAEALGVPFSSASRALSSFSGVDCRLEKRGVFRGITVYFDYAHHPTEIRASLAALRTAHPAARLFCIFQPHTYSRTAAFFHAFAEALSLADTAILADIYAAREQNESGVSSEALAAAVRGGLYAESPDAALGAILAHARAGDTLVVMGAGDIREKMRPLLFPT